MTRTTHTPGPWHVTNKRRGVHVAYVGPKNRNVATVLSGVESHANARLIAAAPDLLEALHEAESYADLKLRQYRAEGMSETHAMILTPIRLLTTIRAAIAKAQGDA